MDSEDLYNNVFLKTLKLKYPKTFQVIESSCYMLCIPHSLSLYGMNITQHVLESHILIGSKFYQDEYETYNRNATYTIENSLIIDKADPSKKIKILFDEICYNKDFKPYRFFCIEYPLVGGTGIKPSISMDGEDFGLISRPQKPTFDHSKTFLLSPSTPCNRIIINKLDDDLGRVQNEIGVLTRTNESQLLEQLKRLHEKYLDDLVCANVEYKELRSNERQMNNLSMHLESYIFGKIGKYVYNGLKDIHREKNNFYYEKMLMLSDLSLEDMGVNGAFSVHMTKALEAMFHFQHQDLTPIDKLLTVIQASSEIETSIKASSLLQLSDQTLAITGDEAFPLISFLLIQTHPRNLESDLQYCINYILSKISSTSLEYNLINLQASLEHIKQLIEANQNKLDQQAAKKVQDEQTLLEQQTSSSSSQQSIKKPPFNLPTYLSSNSLLSSYTSNNNNGSGNLSSFYSPSTSTIIPDSASFENHSNNNNINNNNNTKSPLSPNNNNNSSYQPTINRYLTNNNSSFSPQPPPVSKYNASNPFPYQKYTKPPSVISLDDDEGDPW
ncbi:hypothetical protein DFA_04595 [Cavenderia fasciculata]|uniref:VPS9 domain-containing protein n=1 Tax=Cavenderia fasciculata TaxID=261658 RepID=F4PQ04_CACFS|nr:uncharacterized protein DFA_04595 [Cavenderia fasciculata]EGG22467.1 hypothetical protein DFA_04595 [Cavenderia fasciculata]|eukprot:XP_004360318.1 hypothetical protein DFA_04595 [Cavenderia fasciculata]